MLIQYVQKFLPKLTLRVEVWIWPYNTQSALNRKDAERRAVADAGDVNMILTFLQDFAV